MHLTGVVLRPQSWVMASVRTHVVGVVEWWVLVATVALTPLVFSRLTFDVYNIAEVTVLWIGAAVAASLRLIRLWARDFTRLPPLWPAAAAYLAVLALTTLTSRAPMVSFLGNYGRIGGFATALAVVAIAWLLSAAMSGRPDRRRQLLGVVVASATAGALYLWAQQIGLDSVIWLDVGGNEPAHPPGLLGNSNFSGAHVALGVGPAIWLSLRSVGRWRIAWATASLVLLSGIGVSQSRGAMVAAVSALLLAVALMGAGRRPRLFAFAAVAIAVLGVAAIASSNRGFDDLINANTSDQRVDLWEVALRGSPDHLFLGGGPDLYLVTFTENASGDLDGVVANEPHNVLLDHLDGSGLLGAAAWLAVVGATVALGRSRGRGDLAPWTLMGTGYLVQAMVSIDAVPLQLWAWVVVAAVVASAAPDDPRPDARDRVGLPIVIGGLVVAGLAIALVIQPFRADMAYRQAIIASNAGNVSRAVAQFEEAIDRHEWEPRYHARLGLELWGSVDLSDPAAVEVARNELERALDLFPDDPSANAWLEGLNTQAAAAG